MNVVEAVVHRLEKQAGGEVSLFPRDTLLPIDEKTANLANAVLDIYGKVTNRGYGSFDTDTTVYPFSELLQEYVNGERGFLDLSTTTLNLLAAEMQDVNFATGGYALFIRFTNQNRDWLLVVMLKIKAGTSIDPDTLNLSESLTLDVDHLHEAARVNLSAWLENESPYLTFVKRRVGSNDVTRYFRQALGCTDYTDSKANTKALLEAVEKYATAQGWDTELTQQSKTKVYEYCDEKSKANLSASLSAISMFLNEQEPASFTDFIEQQQIKINDEFSPHPATYKRFRRLQGKFDGISISFDADALLSDKVIFDPDTHTLTIKNVSDAFGAEIRKVTG
jgi:nucleoid-associated protein